MAAAVIWPTLGTSCPQRQVLCSASKGVNSSVGLCFFYGHVISVGSHKKNTGLQFLFGTFPGLFAPIACFPQKNDLRKFVNFCFFQGYRR